ncbi:uncharacterized protein BDR25DRAFT_210900, partial [Lindgomyces ingoldianus]
YKSQVCMDFSTVVIEDIAAQFTKIDRIEWRVLEVRHVEDMKDGGFKVIIDKGTLDSMISGSMQDPPEVVKKNNRSCIDEVIRVLKPGVFIYITYI